MRSCGIHLQYEQRLHRNRDRSIVFKCHRGYSSSPSLRSRACWGSSTLLGSRIFLTVRNAFAAGRILGCRPGRPTHRRVGEK